MSNVQWDTFFMGLTVAAHRAAAKARETGEQWCVYLWAGDYCIQPYRGKITEEWRYVVAVTIGTGKAA